MTMPEFLGLGEADRTILRAVWAHARRGGFDAADAAMQRLSAQAFSRPDVALVSAVASYRRQLQPAVEATLVRLGVSIEDFEPFVVDGQAPERFQDHQLVEGFSYEADEIEEAEERRRALDATLRRALARATLHERILLILHAAWPDREGLLLAALPEADELALFAMAKPLGPPTDASRVQAGQRLVADDPRGSYGWLATGDDAAGLENAERPAVFAMRFARKQLAKGDYARAERLGRAALADDHEWPEADSLVAITAALQGRPAELDALVERRVEASESRPNQADDHTWYNAIEKLARQLSARGWPRRAERLLRPFLGDQLARRYGIQTAEELADMARRYETPYPASWLDTLERRADELDEQKTSRADLDAFGLRVRVAIEHARRGDGAEVQRLLRRDAAKPHEQSLRMASMIAERDVEGLSRALLNDRTELGISLHLMGAHDDARQVLCAAAHDPTFPRREPELLSRYAESELRAKDPGSAGDACLLFHSHCPDPEPDHPSLRRIRRVEEALAVISDDARLGRLQQQLADVDRALIEADAIAFTNDDDRTRLEARMAADWALAMEPFGARGRWYLARLMDDEAVEDVFGDDDDIVARIEGAWPTEA